VLTAVAVAAWLVAWPRPPGRPADPSPRVDLLAD
jgi:hypothetical protein